MESASDKVSIFVVVDDPAFAASSAALLREDGFDVEQFSDAGPALDAIDNGAKPQAVLTDLDLPRMDGIAFARALRHRVRLTSMRILLIADEPGDIALSAHLLFDGVYGKPVDPADIISGLRVLLPPRG